MIILDLNQVMIANIMRQIGGNNNITLDENLIRHMVINSIRAYIVKFRKEYGEMVIACDSRSTYWRRDYFPFYKANRKKDRDASGFDWVLIFNTLERLRQELKENFPYKVIEVEGAEADDIIAALTMNYCLGMPILILSADKDFMQLQQYPNVKQYSPLLKKFITADDPRAYVKEHVMRGDRGDGIPNFLSADDTFVTDKRQKPITTKNMDIWIHEPISNFCTTEAMMRGFKRNQTLIDFSYIPPEVVNRVLDTYNTVKVAPRSKLFPYFMEKRLRNLIDSLQDF